MSDDVVSCPVCGHQEDVSFTPTISLDFSAEVEVTSVDCGECGYDGASWPFDDECPECGGIVSGEVLEIVDGQPVKADLWCDGDSHLDDGTSCGYAWKWDNEEKGEV